MVLWSLWSIPSILGILLGTSRLVQPTLSRMPSDSGTVWIPQTVPKQAGVCKEGTPEGSSLSGSAP